MATVEELTARLEAVRIARATGTSVVRFPDGSGITYKTDAELAGAEAALVAQLAAAQGTRIHTILVGSSKGLEA
jgi:hypothetical protein